ncbi:hypothetical protein V6R21_19425 [Limibacter armeniacum]|uniref:hypothetical protein n=1 Tax=Limibacter armeniacum TaxID=466084 RepID=UPI002FE54C30
MSTRGGRLLPAYQDYLGDYITEGYSEGYFQKIYVSDLGNDQVKVKFTASNLKGRAGCSFQGTGEWKANRFEIPFLWGNKTIIMTLTPEDNTVSVSTTKEEDLMGLMYACRGGGSLAGKYEKIKTQKYVGAFSYMADAPMFYTCDQEQAFPVKMTPAYELLEHQYMELTTKKAGEKVYVEVMAYVEEQPAMEGDGTEQALVITDVIKLDPEKECK